MGMKIETFEKDHKLSIFEIAILFIGIVLTFFGFRIIMSLYRYYGEFGWLMVITIFVWLILLVLFILLSIGVDANRRQVKEITLLRQIVHETMKETKLLKKEVEIFSNLNKDLNKKTTKSKNSRKSKK